MNLATTFPRSVHEKYLGVVQLARTIDKAKMAVNSVGDYRYDAMDQALFAEFGIDGKKLSAIVSDVVKNSSNAPNIEAYVKPLVEKKTPLEIQRFNHATLNRRPIGDDLKPFETLRTKIAPDRSDVTSWADLLDLQEGRPVPKRSTAVN
ncbi:MAG TPA: DUF5069 domain-containing protein [Candidatus Limnocylindria bacterium]|jgi:hypothetical protein|nr:DUF5069 domain-containing protein [Candidatus Limnocylindria bacterium]